jgi:hypothetical protein
MKNKSIVALAVATLLASPILSAKEVTQSDLIDSTFSVGYKTRDLGSGVNVDADWQFSDNVGVFGGFNRVSGDRRFTTKDEVQSDEVLYPTSFSLDMTYIEYGVSLRHTFYNVLETPMSIYVKAGTSSIRIDEVEFSTSDDLAESDTESDEGDVDTAITLILPDLDAIKGSVGVKFFINNRTTFDVAYSQYKIDGQYRNKDRTETSVDVELSYFPRKNFGLSFMYESADMTGEPTYNFQATVRW